jgi:hypothetical protein
MMEAYGLYLIKSIAWLTGFTVIYFVFLRSERFFALKRYYLIAGMPDWKPGSQLGRPIDVRFSLPVEFSLDDK